MKRYFMAAATAAVIGMTGASNGLAGDAPVVNANAASVFAWLPKGVIFPEGIAANPVNGDIYVATFVPGGDNRLMRYGRNGRLLGMREMGPEPLLGLAYEPATDMVYISNVGPFVGPNPSRIQRIAADLDPDTLVDVADIPLLGAPPNRVVGNPDGSADKIDFGNNVAVPNALAFDVAGNVYVSDSFQGAVFRINDASGCGGPVACTVDTVAHDGLLATAGHPPFGANGVALNADETALFVANTGDDRVLKLDLASKTLSVFAESVNGADGMVFDADGRLWVAANQADRVVALDGNGKVVAELGAFLGIRNDGSARGLLFPASLAIAGNAMFVTNLALPLTGAADDEPEEEVTRYTISRIALPRAD